MRSQGSSLLGGMGDVSPAPEGLVAAFRGSPRDRRVQVMRYAVFAVFLILAYGRLLISLAIYAVEEDLHSHIVLIPAVSGFLLFRDHHLSSIGGRCRSSRLWALILVLTATLCLAGGFSIAGLSRNDFFALAVGSFLCFLAAGGFFFLGKRWMAAAAFPLAFLIFMVPLPDVVVGWFEISLMIASAEAADLLFALSGTEYWRDGQVIHLPVISLEVAQECSGIRSSWVLLITSVLASYLFLRSRWRRLLLVGVVIPLGILRNGLRVLVIGLLCVHWGPDMVETAIHKRGGPLFFALSLVPFFLLLWILRRTETRARQAPQ